MEKTKLSVSQLNNYIKGVFDDELILKDILVFGEVFECTKSGNATFITLRDEESILHCVGFGDIYLPQIGETVIATGSVDYYSKGNRVSFRLRHLEPLGEGKLRREFLALTEKLKSEGLFANPLTLPNFIRKAAVITSETGAVIHDISVVLKKKHKYIDIMVYPVRVQGETAESTIVSAIELANKRNREDVIVIARGGGSGSDLAAFNTESVARAVAKSKIPVISSVGHEVDVTLCDLCSSLRAGTPSIAAENICRINERFLSRYLELLSRLEVGIKKVYSKSTVSLCRTAKLLTDKAQVAFYKSNQKLISVLNNAERLLSQKLKAGINAVSAAHAKIVYSYNNILFKKEDKLRRLVGALNGANPLKIVASGYAKVYKNGQPVSGISGHAVGESIEVVLCDGILKTQITEVISGSKEI